MKTLSDTLIERLDDPLRSCAIPWKKKLLVRHKKWADTDDHSAGFNLLNEIDITNYPPKGGIAEITEEIENDIDPNEAGYGLIVASQFNQELDEETVGTEDMTKGELLKSIHLEAGDSFSDFYKYEGSDVHLWELVLQLGDIDNDDYVEYTWILGWFFDPDNDLQPRWIGSSRNVSKFTLTACSLLYWLKDVGSAWLGDYSNPSGKYTGEEEEGCDDVCNFSLMPIVRLILNEAGITDDNIIYLKIPPDTGIISTYSTIRHLDKPSTPSTPTTHIPDEFCWKEYTDSDGETWSYNVFVGGWGITTWHPYIYVSAYNVDSGYEELESVHLNTLNSNLPTCRIKRLWYPGGSGNIFYALAEKTDGDYIVMKLTLSGTIGSVASSSSLIFSKDIQSPGSYTKFWGLVDLNQDDDQLWGAVENTATQTDWALGYWGLTLSSNPSGNESWSTVKSYSSSDYHLTMLTDPGVWISGLRCVRMATGDLGVAFFIMHDDGYTHDPLYLALYDSNSDTLNYTLNYDDGWSVSPMASEDSRHPFTDGRGTIGGFSSEEYFYFTLTSHTQQFKGTHDGCRWYVYWPVGDVGSASMGQADGVTGYGWRTFSSHGSADLDHCTGIYTFRPSTGLPRYDCTVAPMVCFITESSFDWEHAHGAAMGDDDRWPLLSAPSIAGDTGLGADSRDSDDALERPFVVFKSYTDSESETQNRAFLIIYSQTWIPNFNYDFTESNPSIAEVLKQVASTYGLIMKIGHDSTIVRPRNDTGEVDKVLTRDHYAFKGQADEVIKGYDGVEINCYGEGASNPYTAGNTNSANVLSVDTDFLLPSRASTRAAALWAEWKYNQVLYKFEARCLPYAEPGDKVTIPRILPPGDNHENFTGIIMRSSLFELNSPIEVKTIDTSGEAVL